MTMNTLDFAQQPSSAAAPRSASLIFKLLSKIKIGHLSLRLPTGEVRYFGESATDASAAEQVFPRAVIQLNNWSLFSAVLKSGDIGFAESYIRDDWSTDSLIDVLALMIANREPLEKAVYGTWIGRLTYRIKHLLNRNSKQNARKNIHAHYDIGNPFYQLWLDPSMTYSSALFEGNYQQELESAQKAKYQRVLREIGAKTNQHILEIGCGWGGLAEQAVLQGTHIKGLTLSTEQLEYAQARLGNLADLMASATNNLGKSKFLLQDYRDEAEQYDGVASIEMFEAVGEAFWPSYFDTVYRSLKPGAKACIQTITIDDGLFERYRMSTDFIQQYIFPGGMLPSQSVFEKTAKAHGLEVINKEAFGLDYAETLKRWRKVFMGKLGDVRAQGFDAPFVRTWEFYLAYCEAAFTYKNTDVVQYTLRRAN
jgi:cyclopropane-fatty-acyl-phospholipid synthase